MDPRLVRMRAGFRSGRLRALATTATIFDPSTLVLSEWLKPNFAGDPWTGTASAGASGGRSLINGVSPTAGTAVSGKTPAAYNGTTQFQTTALHMSDVITGTAGTLACLYKATSAAAPGASAFNDACFLSMAGRGDVAFAINSSGIRAHVLDSTSNTADVSASVATGAWHMAHVRWSSTLLEIGLDGVWQPGVAIVGGVLTTNLATTSFNVGCDFIQTVFFNGSIMEWLSAAYRFSDADLSNYYAYAKATYPAMSLP